VIIIHQKTKQYYGHLYAEIKLVNYEKV